jgi:hypothetical protein
MSEKSKILFENLDSYLDGLSDIFFDMTFFMMSITRELDYLKQIATVEKNSSDEPDDIVVKDMENTIRKILTDYDYYHFIATDNPFIMYNLNEYQKYIFQELGHKYPEIDYNFFDYIEIEEDIDEE